MDGTARRSAAPDDRAAEPPASGPDGAKAYHFAEGAASLLDAAVDTVADTARLEGYRLVRSARGVVARASVMILAATVGVAGFVFLSCGAAMALSARIGSPAAGFLLVGSFYLLAACVAFLILRRVRRSPDDDGRPRS